MDTNAKKVTGAASPPDANDMTFIPSDCRIELKRTPPSPEVQRYMRLADRQARSSPRSEVRMLTPSEIESLQRDKAESGKKLQAMFKAHREQAEKA